MRQMEARECGAVALGILLAYYGKYISLAELREACGVTREGVKVLGIVRAARQYGLEVRVTRRESIPDSPLPCIIYWNFNHFLVVEQVTKKGISVNDPAYGRAYLPNALIHRYFSGIVLTFTPTREFIPSGQPASRLPQRFFHPYILVESGRHLIEILLLGGLLDARLWLLGLPLAVIYVILRFSVLKHTDKTPALFEHLLTLPQTFFSRYYTDDIVGRLLMGIYMGAYHRAALEGIIYAIRATLLAGVLIWLSLYWLGAVGLAAVNFVIGAAIVREAERFDASFHLYRDRLTHNMMNGLHNVEDIRRGGGEAAYLRRFHGVQNEALSQPFPWWEAISAMLPALNLMLLLLLAIAAVEWGGESPLRVMVGGGLALLLVLPAHQAARIFQHVRAFRHQHDRLTDFQTARPAPPLSGGDVAGVTLAGVSFSYGDSPTLQDISLTLPPGGCIGVVGRSGSGKSTLAALIAGWYAPQEGIVKVNPCEVALVGGQPFLLDASLKENLTLWEADISTQALESALRDAALPDLITDLAAGSASLIHGGRPALSQGQAQCLEIARALTRNPKILLLDEAASALDALTEARLLHNLRRRGCALLIVSHRLSAIRHCDEILVMEGGRIIERGNHAALMDRGGLYSGLIGGGEIR